MRRLLPLISLLAAASVYAAEPRPKDLQPLPDAPPPPSAMDSDAASEPQVTITTQGDTKVEEYRINGKLYMKKIIPSSGKPYYLIDNRGDGEFARLEGLDAGVRVPQWVLFNF